MNSKPNIKHIDQLARIMDSRFRLPGTNFRFGLDPILGLIPGVGDLTSYAISGLIIYYISRYGASRKLIFMMTANAALDAIIGSIPIIGQIFDFAYKANEKNMRLLREYYQEGRHQGSGKAYIAFFIIIFIVILILVGFAIWGIIELIASLF